MFNSDFFKAMARSILEDILAKTLGLAYFLHDTLHDAIKNDD